MTSFGAHSTPFEDASEQLEALEAYFENFCVNRNKELTELCSNNA
ncbi:Uncharacterised protein [Cedecea neteri]|uniref:Uncharacterized protein n=1 Tax=Cedecea neteri TaxID=158822 RepID=A0A2X2T483_9ENTR|nr:Uncharacterised protein [Cedecea neteri]